MNEKQISYLVKCSINIEDVEETKAGFLSLKNKKGRVGKPKRFIDRIKNMSFRMLISVYDDLIMADLRPIKMDTPLLFKIVKQQLGYSDKQTYEYVWALCAIDALKPVAFPMQILEQLFQRP